MPELPEVETVRRGLQKYLVGHKILDIQINHPKVFAGETKNARGAKIKKVRRFAKVLVIDLSSGFSFIIHIKLTGQLVYRGPNLKGKVSISKKVSELGGKHTHVIFKLDRGGILYYNDIRRFGWIKLIKTDDVETSSFIGRLGPEPFDSAQGKPALTLVTFKEIVSKYKTPIKQVLMDQEKIAGIGNIYANDALWLSKIHPSRSANSLSTAEEKKLFEAIITVLKRGIESGGASELSFVHADGTDGSYQNYFLAYGKQGQICSHCKKTKIIKIKLGGRGTYFCPKCQTIRSE